MPRIIRPITAIPPTTPPTMAPIGGLGEGPGVGLVDVDVELVDVDVDVEVVDVVDVCELDGLDVVIGSAERNCWPANCG